MDTARKYLYIKIISINYNKKVKSEKFFIKTAKYLKGL